MADRPVRESPDYLPYIILGAILLLVLVVALIRQPRRKKSCPGSCGGRVRYYCGMNWPRTIEADKSCELRNKVANIAQEKPRMLCLSNWLAEK